MLSEGGIGWLPHIVEHADYVWHRHGRWTGCELPEPPSHYVPDHLYAKDPDGLEFEVSWLVPHDMVTPELLEARGVNRPLDLDAEVATYGLELAGGGR